MIIRFPPASAGTPKPTSTQAVVVSFANLTQYVWPTIEVGRFNKIVVVRFSGAVSDISCKLSDAM
jgi:hypothetical protein